MAATHQFPHGDSSFVVVQLSHSLKHPQASPEHPLSPQLTNQVIQVPSHSIWHPEAPSDPQALLRVSQVIPRNSAAWSGTRSVL